MATRSTPKAFGPSGSIRSLISMVALAAALAGCGTSPPPKFYALSSASAPDGAPPADVAVLVGPVSIPADVDRPQFVVQKGPNSVEVDEYSRWSAPLNDSIARVVAADLSVLLGSPDVATASLANFKAQYRVTIDVQRFDSIRGQGTTLEAVWVVRKANGETRSGRTVAHETVSGDGFDTLAAAHSRALAKMSADIAGAIRAEAAATADASPAPAASKTAGA